jgi:hypothetical protein
VLYEMIAGRLPFAGTDTFAIANAIVHDTPPPLTRHHMEIRGLGVINVSAGISELISLMLSRNVERPTPMAPSHFAED